MKKIKHLILLALAALALGLASLGAAAAPLAGGRSGIGGDVHTLASGLPSGQGGEWRAGEAAPAVAGSNTVRAGQETN